MFRLTVPNRVYMLSVDDPKEFADWCEAFEFVAGAVRLGEAAGAVGGREQVG